MGRNHRRRHEGASPRSHRIPADEVLQLNTEFYGSLAVDELSYQLLMNLLMLEPREELLHLLTTNSPTGADLHVRALAIDSEKLRSAAALGVLVVSQHIAETLLRLLYVHACEDECTWVALAELRERDVVHKIARDISLNRITTPRARLDLEDVVLKYLVSGRDIPDRERAAFGPSAKWGVEWVRYAAGLATGSQLYNSYKHGLTLSYRPPLPIGFAVEGTSYDDSMDTSFTYLRRPVGEEAARCACVQDFEPVDVSQRGVAALVLLHLLGNTVFIGARARGVPSSVESIQTYPVSFTPESVARKRESPVILEYAPREFGSPRGR
ncbi:MAG: hypothetical protein Q8K99_04945 [Actinomycetota bacterium]|nr:hypothetical protein [Actinomycetota bacterium]